MVVREKKHLLACHAGMFVESTKYNVLMKQR